MSTSPAFPERISKEKLDADTHFDSGRLESYSSALVHANAARLGLKLAGGMEVNDLKTMLESDVRTMRQHGHNDTIPYVGDVR